MSDVVQSKKQGNIAIVTMTLPPMNVLSAANRAGLYDALTAVRADPEIAGVILTGAGRCFSAGADITEFQSKGEALLSDGRDLNEICGLLDACEKPVVAAIHGFAFGGGFEVALSCHFRVAAPGSQVGLPEVNLGLLPGAGGTQRTPRLVGVEKAYQMIVSGNPVGIKEAKELGLVDVVVEGDLIAGATAFLNRIIAEGGTPRRVRDITISTIPEGFFAKVRAAGNKKKALAFATQRIIDCIEAAATKPFDDGMRIEREQFLACFRSTETKALQHAFFAQREANKIPGIPPGTQERPVKTTAVLGGGTMGRGITISLLTSGYPVVLLEADSARLEAGLAAIRAEIEKLGGSGKLKPDLAAASIARLSGTLDYADLGTVDLVIEAVFENMEIKKEVAAKLGEVCKPGAVIASNTSTLDVDILAQASGRPADYLGMHFFSPAHVMKLLEVVRGKATAPDALLTSLAVGRKMQKHTVVSGVCYGFIGNRMLESYIRESEALLLEGATPSQIDKAIEAWGMAMGPLRMMDLAGVDVGAKVVIEREKEGKLPADPSYRIVSRELNKLGRHGQKTGKGYYRYEGRNAIEDPEALEVFAELARGAGIAKRNHIEDSEIVERCLLPLINEGFKIVEEGIAYRYSDLDIVYLSGYGFPAERGGPMFYAATAGFDKIRDRLRHYAQTRGDAYGYWTPAASLEAKAAEIAK
jgi:3-hydroxyacyl-CoA dehydrogenase